MNLLKDPQRFQVQNGADAVAKKLYEKAVVRGNFPAIQFIFERICGRAPQTVNLTATAIPTTEIISRLVSRLVDEGIDEVTARRVILQLGSGE